MALGSRFCAAISPNFDSSGTSVVSLYLLMTLKSPFVHRVIAWACFCLDPIVGVVVVADFALLILSWLHRIKFADTAFFSFCDAPVFNCLHGGSLRSSLQPVSVWQILRLECPRSKSFRVYCRVSSSRHSRRRLKKPACDISDSARAWVGLCAGVVRVSSSGHSRRRLKKPACGIIDSARA
jgi:hypothetical protein